MTAQSSTPPEKDIYTAIAELAREHVGSNENLLPIYHAERFDTELRKRYPHLNDGMVYI
jgi:hypothetical protein